jgi:hypothetical protein
MEGKVLESVNNNPYLLTPVDHVGEIVLESLTIVPRLYCHADEAVISE